MDTNTLNKATASAVSDYHEITNNSESSAQDSQALNSTMNVPLEKNLKEFLENDTTTNKPVDTESAKNWLKITLTLVKFVGAGTVAVAMGLFLFEGLNVAGDIQRFFTIAGFGALMTALGLAVYYGLKDRVASRLFLGLSLASVPLVTAVLGGLIFSLTDAAKELAIPSALTWVLPNTASLYLALPIGLLTIAAITAFGFMVMARSEWRWMTPTLLITNALMLIPNRSTGVVTTIALLSISALFWLIKNKTNNRSSLKTLEGSWAVGILFVAPLVSVARTAWLYDYSPLMNFSVAGLLFIGARLWLNASEPGTKTSVGAAIITFVCAAAAIVHANFFLMAAVPDLFQAEGLLFDGEGVIAAALLLAASLDVTGKNPKHFISKVQGVITCLFAGIAFLSPVVNYGGLFISALALLIPMGFSVLHWHRGNKAAAGILIAYVIAIFFLSGPEILNTIAHSGWWGLAVAGCAIMVGGAALERTLSTMKTPRIVE